MFGLYCGHPGGVTFLLVREKRDLEGCNVPPSPELLSNAASKAFKAERTESKVAQGRMVQLFVQSTVKSQ